MGSERMVKSKRWKREGEVRERGRKTTDRKGRRIGDRKAKGGA